MSDATCRDPTQLNKMRHDQIQHDVTQPNTTRCNVIISIYIGRELKIMDWSTCSRSSLQKCYNITRLFRITLIEALKMSRDYQIYKIHG